MSHACEEAMTLVLRDVHKAYALPDVRMSREVLAGVSLTLRQGESVSIVGPSGSGKSTLLNLMGGLDAPSSGTVRLLGRDLASLDDRELARMRNQEIGFVFQLHHLLPQCTVLENVLLPTLPFDADRGRDEALHRAKTLCARVGLSHVADCFPAQLSGGEQQRTAVVRALINRPRLILADEPTGALDEENAERLVHLLLELKRDANATLVVVTHSMPVAEGMDRVCQLHAGRLL